MKMESLDQYKTFITLALYVLFLFARGYGWAQPVLDLVPPKVQEDLDKVFWAAILFFIKAGLNRSENKMSARRSPFPLPRTF